MTHRIVPELLALAVPIDSVRPHPRNVHTGDVGTIAESLEAHGQYKPIVVQASTGLICAGNHTWKGAKRLQWDTVAAVLRDIDDEAALRILLIDNRSSAKGSDDQSALAELLRELEDLAGTGYSPEDLADLLGSLDAGDGGAGAGDGENEGEDAEQEEPASMWGVIVTCASEDEQAALLEQLAYEGRTVRALMG